MCVHSNGRVEQVPEMVRVIEIKQIVCMYEYIVQLKKDVTYLSAPAHESILLMRITCQGWTLTRIWKFSLAPIFTMYLLQQMRAASRASLDNCSLSKEMRCTQKGNSSAAALFLPRSKMRILASGTPRQ
jgi:hypothetical protein